MVSLAASESGPPTSGSVTVQAGACFRVAAAGLVTLALYMLQLKVSCAARPGATVVVVLRHCAAALIRVPAQETRKLQFVSDSD